MIFIFSLIGLQFFLYINKIILLLLLIQSLPFKICLNLFLTTKDLSLYAQIIFLVTWLFRLQ